MKQKDGRDTGSVKFQNEVFLQDW